MSPDDKHTVGNFCALPDALGAQVSKCGLRMLLQVSQDLKVQKVCKQLHLS